jgi:hypothetical protein
MRKACRKLPNEELHPSYCSSHITWLIKSKKTRQAQHTAPTEEKTNPYTACEENVHFEDLGVNGRIVSNICLINNKKV